MHKNNSNLSMEFQPAEIYVYKTKIPPPELLNFINKV